MFKLLVNELWRTLCENQLYLSAITSSTVNRFWKFFHCWKQQWIICKINMIFLQPLKASNDYCPWFSTSECLLLFSADLLYSLSCRSYWASACYRWSIKKQTNTSGLSVYHGHLIAAAPAEDKMFSRSFYASCFSYIWQTDQHVLFILSVDILATPELMPLEFYHSVISDNIIIKNGTDWHRICLDSNRES